MTKTVLITGGAGGIGREFCKLFNADGYRIIVFSLLQEELDALGNDLKAQRPDVKYHAVRMDLSPIASLCSACCRRNWTRLATI